MTSERAINIREFSSKQQLISLLPYLDFCNNKIFCNTILLYGFPYDSSLWFKLGKWIFSSEKSVLNLFRNNSTHFFTFFLNQIKRILISTFLENSIYWISCLLTITTWRFFLEDNDFIYLFSLKFLWIVQSENKLKSQVVARKDLVWW